jgi:hypothetical protein
MLVLIYPSSSEVVQGSFGFPRQWVQRLGFFVLSFLDALDLNPLVFSITLGARLTEKKGSLQRTEIVLEKNDCLKGGLRRKS